MKKLVAICLGVLVIAIIAVVIAISMVDVNQYKDDVIQLVEEKTGRRFAVDGDFELALSLIPTVVVEGVHFGNADWGSSPDMLSVDRLEVQISLIPLLNNTISVNRLILVAPEINLETGKKGQGNWVLDAGEKQAARVEKTEPVELPSFAVNDVRIKEARITYKDGATGEITRLAVDEITVAAGGVNDPLTLTVKAVYDDMPFSIAGTMGTIKQLMSNSSYPVKLEANINSATLGLDGHIARPMEAAGLDIDISFDVDSLASLSELSGSELPDFGPVRFAGKLTDIDGGYSLKPMTLSAGATDLAGDITVQTAARPPILKANLQSSMIDLAAFESDEKEIQKAKVFSSDPLPLAGLRAANIDLGLMAKKIQTRSTTLENVKLALVLNNGKLSLKPLNGQLAGGTLESTLVLDGSGKEASLSTDLNIKNLQPGLLPDLKDKVSGASTDITIKARGTGNSVAAIMASLNGNVLVKSGAGQLKSEQADLATSGVFLKTFRMLNPAASGDQGTQIQCFVTKMDIKDGIAPIDKGIALVTNHMNVIGSGSINFKTEELDLGVTPQAREGIGISAGQLAELVRLSGTFANPKIAPDTRAAFKAGLSAGAAVATGGLSILAQGLFDRSTADTDPCATALGIKTAKTTAANKDTPEKSTTEKAVDTVKEAGTAVTDKFKSLFGK